MSVRERSSRFSVAEDAGSEQRGSEAAFMRLEQGRRLRNAIIVVAGTLAALAVCGHVEGGQANAVYGEVVPGGLKGLSFEERVRAYEVAAPAWFEQELFEVDAAISSYGDDNVLLYGFVFEGNGKERFPDIRLQMEENGWTCVESGVEMCATFVREEGSYQWAMVGCVQAGNAVAVTVQLR